MKTATITIPVDDDVARAFAAASPQNRRKMELLVNLQLRDLTANRARLTQVMDEMGRQAKDRGLTQGGLDEILKDVS